MQKLKQKSITVNMTGRSKFEVESMYPELDNLNIYQSDSSVVVFEMSPDYRKQPVENGRIITEAGGKIQFHTSDGLLVEDKSLESNNFDEGMSIQSLHAIVKDHSLLDVGHAQIKNIKVNVSDSSAIVLSGKALSLSKQKDSLIAQ